MMGTVHSKAIMSKQKKHGKLRTKRKTSKSRNILLQNYHTSNNIQIIVSFKPNSAALEQMPAPMKSTQIVNCHFNVEKSNALSLLKPLSLMKFAYGWIFMDLPIKQIRRATSFFIHFYHFVVFVCITSGIIKNQRLIEMPRRQSNGRNHTKKIIFIVVFRLVECVQ